MDIFLHPVSGLLQHPKIETRFCVTGFCSSAVTFCSSGHGLFSALTHLLKRAHDKNRVDMALISCLLEKLKSFPLIAFFKRFGINSSSLKLVRIAHGLPLIEMFSWSVD